MKKTAKKCVCIIMSILVAILLPIHSFAISNQEISDDNVLLYVYEAVLLDSANADSPFYDLDIARLSLGERLSAYHLEEIQLVESRVAYIPVFYDNELISIVRVTLSDNQNAILCIEISDDLVAEIAP